jgi:hypothetical protein
MLILLILLAVPAAYCAAGPQEEQVKPSKLTVTPAPEPEPPLKYRFALDHLEQEEGNAAPLYLRAALMASRVPEEAEELVESFLDMPDEQFAAVGALRIPYEDAIHEVEMAAKRQKCEWDLPLTDGPSMLLPDLNLYRHIAKALALRARVEIAEGEYETALATLRTGLTMARQVGKARALINGLVGIAVADYMLDQVEDFVEASGSQNLYWALTQLPSPLVDLRSQLETEMHWLELWHPALGNPEEARLSLEGWRRIFRDLGQLTYEFDQSPTVIGLSLYPAAKQHLLDKGRSAEEVDAMPVLQVVAVYLVDAFNRWAQEKHKWFYVPYPEARKGLERFEERFQEESDARDALLARILLPALDRAYFQQVKLDRRIAALRCIEAVRMYAAAHGGRLPTSLEDIESVPVPVNPARNEPFDYRLKDGNAILSAPLEPYDPPHKAILYEIRIRDRTEEPR